MPLPRQGAAGVLPEIPQGFGAFFQAGDGGIRAQGFDPQPQAAGAGAEVQHPGVLHPFQLFHCRLGHHFGVGPGAQHPRPHRQLKVQKRPPAADILQRFTARPPDGHLFQSGRFFRAEGLAGQAGIPPCCQPEQLPGIKIGVGAAGLFQPGLDLGQGLPGGQAGGYHLPSSGFSGSTGLTAAMATSIMLSSGSNTVSRWTHRPGWRTKWLMTLSERPHHFSSS